MTIHQPSELPGFNVPLHRALTEPVLLAGAQRNVTILNGTLAAAIGLGLQLWLGGVLIWLIGQAIAVWATRQDPQFTDVLARHMRLKPFLSV